jgi:hypothetical protein
MSYSEQHLRETAQVDHGYLEPLRAKPEVIVSNFQEAAMAVLNAPTNNEASSPGSNLE